VYPGVIEKLRRRLAQFECLLRATAKGAQNGPKRLLRRLRDLEDQEISRVRRAIRRIDDDRLVEEFRKAERERVAQDLAQTGQFTTPEDIRREAERRAALLREVGERFGDADPATLRELLQSAVSRIVCRWKRTKTGTGRTRHQLAEGRVELRNHEMFRRLWGGVAHAEAS